jgi:Fe-S cluster assembly protein SufD
MGLTHSFPLEESLHQLGSKANAKAWHLFLQQGLPTKQLEAFSYVGFDKLYHKSFSCDLKQQAMTVEDLPKSLSPLRFVLLDGVLNKELSSLELLPEQVIYGSIQQAKQDFSSLLQNLEDRFYEEKGLNGLDFFNEACYAEGFFLYIPPKCIVLHPIECLHVFTQEVSPAKSLIFVGKGAEVEFIHKRYGSCAILATSRQEYHLEAGSHCNVILDSSEVCSPFFEKIIARLKKDSHLSMCQISQGSVCFRQEFTVDLLEENSEVELKGICAPSGSNQHHVFITVNHHAMQCRSYQHFKCLLNESAKASFEGKIWVAQQADKTQAYQLCNHLVLSPKAHAFAKPNLEIFADDVKASHGATIAQLSEEDLFYLQARGLKAQEAKELLIKGFYREITQHLSLDLQTKIEKVFFGGSQSV